MNKALLLLPVLCYLMVACEPESIEPDPLDYRLQYVGDYSFTINFWSYSAGAYPDPIYRDTAWYYSGSISLVDDSLKNRILVHWGDDASGYYSPHLTQSNKMIVDTAGVLSYPEYCNTIHNKFQDAFIRNDTIRWEFTAGGTGSWRSWTVTGVREEPQRRGVPQDRTTSKPMSTERKGFICTKLF